MSQNICATTATWNNGGVTYDGLKIGTCEVNINAASSFIHIVQTGTCNICFKVDNGMCINDMTIGNYPSDCRNTTFVGAGAGQCNTVDYVTGVGAGALRCTSTALYSTAVGYNAGYKNNSTCSVHFGAYAGAVTVGGTGCNVTNIGAYAGCGTGTSTSVNTVAIGMYADCNTIGKTNTVSIGYQAGSVYNTCYSVCIGGQAGGQTRANCSVLIGSLAMYAKGAAVNPNNVVIGHNAAMLGTIYVSTVAIGWCAGRNNSTDSVYIGSKTGANSVVTSNCNTIIGDGAACGFTTSNCCNVIIGSCCAFRSITNGSRNVMIDSARGVDRTANSSINDSVLVGCRGFRNTTGAISCSVALGDDAGCLMTAAPLLATMVGARSGSHASGAGACVVMFGNYTQCVTANRHTRWGRSTNNCSNCVYAAWTTVSDCRDKTDIVPLSDAYGVEFICRLNPVKFRLDDREEYVSGCSCIYGEKDPAHPFKTEKFNYGFIAQEVESVKNDLGIDFDAVGYSSMGDKYSMSYTDLLAPIIKSLKEIITTVITLEQEVVTLNTI